MTDTKKKPQILVLGGNFAGLGAAQKIRQYAGDSVNITVMDLRDYLLFVPNIPSDVMENRNPELRERMQLRPVLASDDITFVLAKVERIDIDTRTVEFRPVERAGEECQTLHYDILVLEKTAGIPF